MNACSLMSKYNYILCYSYCNIFLYKVVCGESILSTKREGSTSGHEKGEIQSCRRRPHHLAHYLRGMEELQVFEPLVLRKLLAGSSHAESARCSQTACYYHGQVYNSKTLKKKIITECQMYCLLCLICGIDIRWTSSPPVGIL